MVSLLLLTASLELLLFFESAPAAATEHVAMKKKMGGPGPCVIANCSKVFFTCMLETQCRQANLCNAKCLSKKNIEGCNLLCEVLYGHNSTKYRSLLQCMNDHSCLPVSPPDGICLANDTDAIKNLTDMTQVKGKWWIVRGLNCGQSGWPAGFDYLPCQRDEFMFVNGSWIDRVAYCGGSNSTCKTPVVYSVANVSLMTPGVLTVNYTDTPLVPQNEKWRVLSWPHPHWMLIVYCGFTPTGPYAGGMVTRSAETADAIPAYVEKEFRSTALKFGFNYDTMCVTDVTNCTD